MRKRKNKYLFYKQSFGVYILRDFILFYWIMFAFNFEISIHKN